MKLVQLYIVRDNKKTEPLTTRLNTMPDHIIHASKSKSYFKLVITDILFMQCEFLIDQLGDLVQAKVFYIDESSILERARYLVDIKKEDPAVVAQWILRETATINKSKYHPLTDMISPHEEDDWQALKRALYHLDYVVIANDDDAHKNI